MTQEALRNFTEAYQKHLKDLNRPHLGFSAIFPLFFASLRSGRDVSATSCGRAQLVRCEDHITDALLGRQTWQRGMLGDVFRWSNPGNVLLINGVERLRCLRLYCQLILGTHAHDDRKEPRHGKHAH